MEQEKWDDIPDMNFNQFEKLYDSGKDITFGFIRFIMDRLKIQEDSIKVSDNFSHPLKKGLKLTILKIIGQ